MKLAYVLVPVLLASSSAAVADITGNINFTGVISVNTCEIETAGKDVNVDLPTVSEVSLKAANSTAGEKSFTLNFVKCSAGSVAAAFPVSANSANLDGDHIKNTAPAGTAAGNVAIALYDSGGVEKIKLSEAGATSGYVDIPVPEEGQESSGSITLVAKYISVAGSATGGEVAGQLKYQVEYK